MQFSCYDILTILGELVVSGWASQEGCENK
jgi:hypothetical protein